MRGFTLWEPWATLMAHGYKKNETRGWKTNYRGPLLIHAAKTDREAGAIVRIWKETGLPDEELYAMLEQNEGKWPLGKVVAIVNLVDCISTEVTAVSKVERACGDYSKGRFVWVTTGLRRVDPPVPWKGKQGLWKVPEELAAQLPELTKA